MHLKNSINNENLIDFFSVYKLYFFSSHLIIPMNLREIEKYQYLYFLYFLTERFLIELMRLSHLYNTQVKFVSSLSLHL